MRVFLLGPSIRILLSQLSRVEFSRYRPEQAMGIRKVKASGFS
jgi:hypothetical protein